MPSAKIGVIGGSGLYEIEGMTDIEEIEIRGKSIHKVAHAFKRPRLYKWSDISPIYGNEWI